ncbi:MAG: isoprenylcysteine carboxylmethyltransferase family protein [Bacteroidetes bacterium]|nr:isoprenylcysteine carboxylmethyltransferase family protein [Bacteroidota bacterium]
MESELIFRIALIVIVVAMAGISATFRSRAHRDSGKISRSKEGWKMGLFRLVFALLLYLPIFAYMIRPAWMSWSEIALPEWMRLTGLGMGIIVIPLIYLVFRAIGSNISETVFTKESHRLITTGIYTRVRHPLYMVSALALVSFSLLTANWFIAAMSVISMALILAVVVPKEEKQLIQKFGDDYRNYQKRSGKMWPRF